MGLAKGNEKAQKDLIKLIGDKEELMMDAFSAMRDEDSLLLTVLGIALNRQILKASWRRVHTVYVPMLEGQRCQYDVITPSLDKDRIATFISSSFT
jgi:hypothetical protein